MDPFRNLVGIGGAGCREVTVDPSRVQAEEFETAKVFAQVLWGPEGLAEMLGPTWSLVHDPRFLAIERMWAKEDAGMLGGVVRRGVSVIQALDLNSTIKVVEDPQLYSEMLAEGRHFLAVCKANDVHPGSLRHREIAERLVRQECPNYIRRNGDLNDEAEDLIKMLQIGLVSMIADYARLAYSQDWVRMDTGEVAAKDEVFWDKGTGMQVPVIAAEVDTIHKALVMRAQIRTTALRLMKGFPGIKDEEFEALELTDNESDRLCQLLFKSEYDKLYMVMPEIRNLLAKAKHVPFAQREEDELATMAHDAADFHAKLESGEIQPVLTPIEEDPNAAVDPGAFLYSLSSNPYLGATFTALQNLGERGDKEAEELCLALFKSGGTSTLWGKVDDLLLARKVHPKQGVFEGRDILTDWQKVYLREAFEGDEGMSVYDPELDEGRKLTTEEIDKVIDVREHSFCHDPRALAMAVLRRGHDASVAELADLACEIKRELGEVKPERKVHVIEETNDPKPEPKATGTQVEGTTAFYLDFK